MENLSPDSKTSFPSMKVRFEVAEISTYSMAECKEMLDLMQTK